jgi:arsenate reductase
VKVKVYEYQNCSTCKKALKFLDSKHIKFDKIAIVDQPPSLTELKLMLTHLKERGDGLKQLFNTSGQQYRELGVSEKLKAGMTEAEALKLLSANGKLIKRPFLLTDKCGTVGFDEAAWIKILT